MAALEWWQWAGTVAMIGVFSPLIVWGLQLWWNRRRETQQILSAEEIKKVFQEAILPGLRQEFRGWIREEVQVAVQARGLRHPGDH